MRHRVAFSSLGRPTAERIQLFRNLITSLIINDQISTTLAKAKQVRPLAEKVITAAKKGKRAKLLQWVYSPETTLPQLFNVLTHRYSIRERGYTRIHRLPNYQHDQSPRAILELVDNPKDLRREKVAGLVAREMMFGWAQQPKIQQREEERREITGFLYRVQKGIFGEKEAVAVVEKLLAEPEYGKKQLISEETRKELVKVFQYIPKDKKIPLIEHEKRPLGIKQEFMEKEEITNPTDVQRGTLAKPYTYNELALAFLVRTWRHSLRMMKLDEDQSKFAWDRDPLKDPDQARYLRRVKGYKRPFIGSPLEPGQRPISAYRKTRPQVDVRGPRLEVEWQGVKNQTGSGEKKRRDFLH